MLPVNGKGVSSPWTDSSVSSTIRPLHGIFKSIPTMCFIFSFITGSYIQVMTSMVVQVAGIQSAEPMKTFFPRCKYKYTGMFQIAVDDTVAYPDISLLLYARYQWAVARTTSWISTPPEKLHTACFTIKGSGVMVYFLFWYRHPFPAFLFCQFRCWSGQWTCFSFLFRKQAVPLNLTGLRTFDEIENWMYDILHDTEQLSSAYSR